MAKKTAVIQTETPAQPEPKAEATPTPEPVTDDVLTLKRADGRTYASVTYREDARGHGWCCLLAHGLEGDMGLALSLVKRRAAFVRLLHDGSIAVMKDL